MKAFAWKSPSTGARDAILAVAIAALATLAVYHRGLVFPFALDDYTYLFRAAGIDPNPDSLRRLVGTTLYYRLGYEVFGVDSTLPWHLINFAFHVGNAFWVYAFARRFGVARDGAWLATGLFAASPLAFTVLYWVACTQELMSGFFVLASIWMALRKDNWGWVSVPLFVVAVLCKESVLLAPLVLPFLGGRRVLPIAITQITTGAILFVGSGLHERMFVSERIHPYATNYGAGLLTNLATALVWLVSPWRDYPDRSAMGDPSLLPWAAGVLLLGAIAFRVAARRNRAQGFGGRVLLACAWFVALLLPTLPLYQHFYAYYLYVPQIGFVILFASGLLPLLSKWFGRSVDSSRQRLVMAVAAVTICGAFSHRNARTHETLMEQTVLRDSIVRYARLGGKVQRFVREADLPPSTKRIGFLVVEPPRDMKATSLGEIGPGQVRIRKIPLRILLNEGRFIRLHFPPLEGGFVTSLVPEDEQHQVFYQQYGQSSLLRVPDVATAYVTLAYNHLLQERYDEARRHAERSLELGGNDAVAHLVLAGVFAAEGRDAEAEQIVSRFETKEYEQTLRVPLQAVRQIIERSKRGR